MDQNPPNWANAKHAQYAFVNNMQNMHNDNQWQSWWGPPGHKRWSLRDRCRWRETWSNARVPYSPQRRWPSRPHGFPVFPGLSCLPSFQFGYFVSKFLQEHLQASLVTFGNQPDVKVTTLDPWEVQGAPRCCLDLPSDFVIFCGKLQNLPRGSSRATKGFHLGWEKSTSTVAPVQNITCMWTWKSN